MPNELALTNSSRSNWQLLNLALALWGLGIATGSSATAAPSEFQVDDRLISESGTVSLPVCDPQPCLLPAEVAQLPVLPPPPPSGVPPGPSYPYGAMPVPVYMPPYGVVPVVSYPGVPYPGPAPTSPDPTRPPALPSPVYPYGSPYPAYPYGAAPIAPAYPYGQAPANIPPGMVAYPSPYGAPGYPYVSPLPPLPAPGTAPSMGVPPGAGYPYGVVVLVPPGYPYATVPPNGPYMMAPPPGGAAGYPYNPNPVGGAVPTGYPYGAAAYPYNPNSVGGTPPTGAYSYGATAYPYNPNSVGGASPAGGYPYGAIQPNSSPPNAIAPTAQTYPLPVPQPPVLQSQPGLEQPAPGRSAPATLPYPSSELTSGKPLIRSTALNQPTLRFQGVYLLQGEDGSGRARVAGVYPLTPNLLAAGTVDFTNGQALTDSQGQGVSINELFLAASLPDLPNLRLAVGQLDLTSYFDRNSFAKDGASQFFNPVFQTNPALAAAGISSRQGALLNWSITDNAELKAAVFSSAGNVSNFSLNGFAGELGLRFGNVIVRGTYASDQDLDSRSGFREIFQVNRGQGRTGFLRGDREESYGLNVEAYLPELRMGVFGRYGRYNNLDINQSGDTYSVGLTFLDLFSPNDRLGIAYGRELSNDRLRQQAGSASPDVVEAFYDFALLSNLRLGFSAQSRAGFSETFLGIRVKTEFDLIPPNRAP